MLREDGRRTRRIRDTMRDHENQENDAAPGRYAALRWVLVLFLTALIVRGGVAMLGREVWKPQDMKGLFVVAIGAVGGLWYLVSTLLLGTKHVESQLGVSWGLVAALAVVVVLAILYCV
jgi:hypothetical protein